MADFQRTIDCSSADEFLSTFTPWATTLQLRGYVYRGHCDAAYKLVPSSLRPESKDRFWSLSQIRTPPENDPSEPEYAQALAEFNILRAFYKSADQRGLYVPNSERVRSKLARTFNLSLGERKGEASQHWLPRDLEDLAGLAQHYGIPTRLLDWSNDPFVAAYFAACSSKPGGLISVWMLNVEYLAFMADTVHAPPLSIVTPPYFGNPNLAAQSGLFTAWNVEVGNTKEFPMNSVQTNRRSLDELLAEHFREAKVVHRGRELFIHVRLDSRHCGEVLDKLSAAGYSAARCFPGYRGVAEDILKGSH